MTTNGSKHNGSGLNGSGGNGAGGGGDDDKDKNKIVHFPTLAERDRIRKEKIAKEEAWQAEYKAKQKVLKSASNPPFLNLPNIPMFVRILLPTFVIIHALHELLLSDAQQMELFLSFGFVPAFYTGEFRWTALFGPITHLYLHGDWMHLAFNTIMMTAMGAFFARELGNKIAWMFFFACGLGGALMHFAFNIGDHSPLIGASGAISGFFAVFLVTMYKRGGFHQFKLVRDHGLMVVIGFWLLLMFLIAIIMGGQSWEAHMGGFIVGLFMLTWLVRKDLKFWRL
jgi:membrane associated rhomboid family serine protease